MDKSDAARPSRRSIACDECKRRKVRCSAEPQCRNCRRDGKSCTYSSAVYRVSALERTVSRYETLVSSMKRAWAVHLPHVPLEKALLDLDGNASSTSYGSTANPDDSRTTRNVTPPDTGVPHHGRYSSLDDHEHHNPEDFEFDESQESGGSIDGMGILTLEPFKAGYTGPQSGIAALKVLRSLPIAQQIDDDDETSRERAQSTPDPSQQVKAATSPDALINDYFKYYHPAYPLLHEGSFRARLSGALAKPRDGSWLLLYNMVLALGAFSGDTEGGDHDLNYSSAAKQTVTLSVLEKGSLSYVQGLALMADYLQKRNKPNASFALVGIAWSMAMSIGLHREFGPLAATAFTMELRRRTWWTLYSFVSGAQLTLGRPPASLIGINLRSPLNVDDSLLAVDMDELPSAKSGPTATSCLIAQIPLANIANQVQAALLTHQVPMGDVVDRLDADIGSWLNDLPWYLKPNEHLELQLELPKRVLIWKAYHLRIVLNRPFLFQAITRKSDLTQQDLRMEKCVETADMCVDSICEFLDQSTGWTRGFAWYATYCLIPASFVHAICLAYAPESTAAEKWKVRLQHGIHVLQKVNFAHCMADRARRILQRCHDHFAGPQPNPQALDDILPDFMANNFEFSAYVPDLSPTNPMQWIGLERHLQNLGAETHNSDLLWSLQSAADANFAYNADPNLVQDVQDGSTMF